MSLQWISEELEINKNNVSTIIHQDTGKHKICSCFVPSRRKHACTLLKISLTRMTIIQLFCKPSSQLMRADDTNTIRSRSGEEWNAAYHVSHAPKRARPAEVWYHTILQRSMSTSFWPNAVYPLSHIQRIRLIWHLRSIFCSFVSRKS
ncbi:hypothetical protein NPIL_474891 [Nephila pilipes]|uniref:Uncharacterized protein n=1 Tax=Nephila pilipes TaxID=299642 RepID=A0A8X6TA83_NEPPI|nr:hypothetical protein NPIL_474891 [Nephila pilipes]